MVKGSKQEMLVARAKAPLGLNFFSHDYLCAESTPLHILGLWGGGGGGESGRGTKRVALSQPRRDERVYLCSLSVYFFCPSSPFSHVISSIGRVMTGIPRREVSSEFQP